MSDQPKPTGEWKNVDGVTIEFGDGDTVQILERLVTQMIVEKHNAALTTERKENKMMRDQIGEHQNQLAAEREKFSKAKEWNQVAELELRNVRSLHNEMMSDMARLSNELSAEREKVQTLVDALIEVSSDLRGLGMAIPDVCDAIQVITRKINTALAKVKEGR